MFHVDPTDPTPAEVQLVRSVRSAIGAGLLAGGEALPTVRQIAVELRVNANAVERAYGELVRDGVLEHRAGAGHFVRETPRHSDRHAAFDGLIRLEDDFLRRAADLGFTLDEVIIHLDSRRNL